jgi:hypothetical protein
MVNELEEMKKMIELSRYTYERDIDHLIVLLTKLKGDISPAIGEISPYEALEAVKKQFNESIDKMIGPY